MPDHLVKIAVALVTSAIVGGFVWVQEMSTRLALVEDDLGETVDVIALLHPPQRAELLQEQVFHTGDKREQMKSKLEQLKQQIAAPPPKGDDDDSAPAPRQES
jgi:hypothetical protein